MRNKPSNYLIFLITIGLLISCTSKNVKKAEEYIEVGMFDEAIAILEAEVKDNPKNAKAHFLCGKNYLLKFWNENKDKIGLVAGFEETMANMKSIGTAIEIYQIDFDKYPSSLSLLTLNYMRKIPYKDAWQNDFSYQRLNYYQDYELISAGPDGKIGSSDDISFSNGRFTQLPDIALIKKTEEDNIAETIKKARESFNRAIKIEQKYGSQAAEAFIEVGEKLLANKRIDIANRLFKESVTIDEAFENNIAQLYASKINELIKSQESEYAAKIYEFLEDNENKMIANITKNLEETDFTNIPKAKKTMAAMRSIGIGLETYSIDYNRYPKSLKALVPNYLRAIRLDAWGNEFEYQPSPTAEDYSLISYGRDGKPGPGPQKPRTTKSWDEDIMFFDGQFTIYPESIKE